MERITTRPSGKQIDRLSALPDDVVRHVLSFLPTKLSVSTSILAKRWRFLWAHVPILDFPSKYFKTAHSRSDAKHSDIIHRVMCLHRAQNLNTFSLSDIHCTEYELETCITIAIDRNLRNLNLEFRFVFPSVPMLPRSLFTCKTLVDLKLVRAICNPSVFAVSMPSLKKFHISFVLCEVDEDIPHLLSGCPVLEELIIEYLNIGNRNLGCLNIYSPTLKRLVLNTHFESLVFDNPDYRLKINAPALRYFKVDDLTDYLSLSSFKHILVSSMTSLIEGDIYLHTCSLEEDEYNTRSGVKFFKCISNVKCLKLSGPYPGKFLAGSFARFDNLTKLEVQYDADWSFITKLLEISDNLEVLIIGVDGIYWNEPKQVPECLLSSIRTIRIDQKVCTGNGFNMVRYFLRNALVLERMEIVSKQGEVNFEARFDAHRKISLFERGSKACQLAFY